MHIKAHAGKGFTNADIEEIVTNISIKPSQMEVAPLHRSDQS